MTDPVTPMDPDPPVSAKAMAFPLVQDHELIRLIGSGSSGQVWLAKNALGTYRAVKLIHKRAFRHQRPFELEFNGVQKFEPVSRLHEGLVDILQVGCNEKAGYFYCVMELADDVATGQQIAPEKYVPRTLGHDLTQQRRLPVRECLWLGASVASALGFLHRHGLIHRDIKPSNIIFINGLPKLADIGLVAAISEDRAYVGTAGFIPKEGPGTVQADIYSLGKVLYEISTGNDRNDYPQLPAQLGHGPEDHDLIQLNKIVLKACRLDPGNRFQSADDLMLALSTFQLSRPEDFKRRKTPRWLARLIGLIGFVIGSAVIVSLLRQLIRLLNQAP